MTLADRFKDLQQGKVDSAVRRRLATLARRKEVSFSIPIFPGGIGAMMRMDAAAPLRAILADAPPPSHPVWRGSPALTFLGKKTFSAVKGTTGESWLSGRLKDLEIAADVVPVDNYEAGIQRVLNGSSGVFRRPGSCSTAQRGAPRCAGPAFYVRAAGHRRQAWR